MHETANVHKLLGRTRTADAPQPRQLASRRDGGVLCHGLLHVLLQIMECRLLSLLWRGLVERNTVVMNLANDLPLLRRELLHERFGFCWSARVISRNRGITL